jgi:glucosamine 6-phosphate synthetase-like amidotransferase/phosphosugar isomerase protein
MCGLCGFITTKGSADERIKRAFRSLLLASADRGVDGTGISVITPATKNYTVKSSIPAYSFVGTEMYKTAMNHRVSVAMGHTREAVVGAVTTMNAHPFVKGNIVGCHNGIVSNYLKIDRKVSVDSEVIFDLIDKEGPVAAFGRLSGSFAISYLDKSMVEPTIHLVRHDNPIYIAVPEDDVFYWASSAHALTAILMGCFYPDATIERIFELPVDQLNSISVKDGKFVHKKKKITFATDTVGIQPYASRISSIKEKEEETEDIAKVAAIISAVRKSIGTIIGVLPRGCDLCTGAIRDTFYIDERLAICCPTCYQELGNPPVVRVIISTGSTGLDSVQLLPAGIPPLKVKPLTIFTNLKNGQV